MVALILVVFGADKAEANGYVADVVITENTGPSLSGTLNNVEDFVEFGYIMEEIEWNYTQEMRIVHFDIEVEWSANGGSGPGRQVTFNVSSENNTAGDSQNDGGGGGTIVITWAVNPLPETVSDNADSLEDFVSSLETDGEWMGGKFTYASKSQGETINDESIDYTISLTYYTWELVNIREILPDLYISTMSFSNDNPEIGDVVTINTTIKLLKTNVTDNFSVTFYVDEISNTTDIGTVEVSKDSLIWGIENQLLVSVNWTAINGTHTIYAVVDSTEVIDESEEKNEISRVITVGFVEPEPNETTDTTEETTTETEEEDSDEEPDYTMTIIGAAIVVALSILGAAVILRN